jgi:putative SOS response-associated peptidase YedK
LSGGVLSIAGLWHEWPEGNSRLRLLSCTLIVADANQFAGRIHGRMPVFVGEECFSSWLDGSAGAELLRPAGVSHGQNRGEANATAEQAAGCPPRITILGVSQPPNACNAVRSQFS